VAAWGRRGSGNNTRDSCSSLSLRESICDFISNAKMNPNMNRKEIYEIYGVDEEVGSPIIDEDEAECTKLNYILNHSSHACDILSDLVLKYRSEYSRETKSHLVGSIATLLLSQGLVEVPISPLTLVPLVIDNLRQSYFDFMCCLEELSEVEGVPRRLFIPVLYNLSLLCSKMTVRESFSSYISALESLLSLSGVAKELEDEMYWGVSGEDIVLDIGGSPAAREGEQPRGGNHRELRPEFPVYKAFSYSYPCFLDGFLEPFIYPKDEPDAEVKAYANKSKHDILGLAKSAYLSLNNLCYSLHSIILPLIRSSKMLRTNFMRYVALVISKNRERTKTVYSWRSCMSDGFAYNMCALLGRFNSKIVQNAMFDKIDPDGVEHLSLVSFPTLCFFSKVCLLELSTMRMVEEIRNISRGLGAIDPDMELNETQQALKTKLSALESLLFWTEYFNEEQAFINFMAEYTEKIDRIWPPFYSQTMLEMTKFFVTMNRTCTLHPSVMGFIEKVMDGDSPVDKGHVVEIFYEKETLQLRFRMINSIVDYYNSLSKDADRFQSRHDIHKILTKTKAFSRMNACKRTLKFINNAMGDFEERLSIGLSSIIEIKKGKLKLEKLEREIKELHEYARRSGGEDVLQQVNAGLVYSSNPELAMRGLLLHYPGLAETMKRLAELRERMVGAMMEHRTDEKKARSSFVFVKGCFELFMHIIDTNPDLFLVDEMVGNFVSVLNCNLKIIVGPRCTDLVIKSPQRYDFDPKDLLRRIVLLYISVKKEKFTREVANEGMYFDIGFFNRALSICESRYLINEAQAGEFRQFIERLKEVVVRDEEAVPEEFIDPLTFNPIRNPIRLLTSKVVIDKLTYDLIMLNDGIDPFTRLPLTENDVVEDVELKKKIDEFYSKRGERPRDATSK
jgi:ubiquitin conjugation factor E4 B